MDSKASVQAEEAAQLDNLDCCLERSLLLVARLDRIFERIGHAGLVALRHHFRGLSSDFGDLERSCKRIRLRGAMLSKKKTYQSKTR